MDLKEYVLGLAVEQGCDLDWRAVIEAAEDDPAEVAEVLDMAAMIAARQLVQAVLAEAADALRGRLARCRLDDGVEELAGDLAQLGAAYRNSLEELTEHRTGFVAAVRCLAGAERA